MVACPLYGCFAPPLGFHLPADYRAGVGGVSSSRIGLVIDFPLQICERGHAATAALIFSSRVAFANVERGVIRIRIAECSLNLTRRSFLLVLPCYLSPITPLLVLFHLRNVITVLLHLPDYDFNPS